MAQRRAAGKEGGRQAAAAAGEWGVTRTSLLAPASDRLPSAHRQVGERAPGAAVQAGSGRPSFGACQGLSCSTAT